MPTNLEQTILRNLLTDESYMRKVLPFIKPDYFEGIYRICLLYTSPSPRDLSTSRMPSSA